ncbi:MAG: H-NS family nucleoid-associated regulatory protein [Pelagimonas sp.]|uniref:H-NS histone family protein n=1 Tax=Pelagimonas sp. TaxID=2073170 RepID=UPI003D6A4065
MALVDLKGKSKRELKALLKNIESEIVRRRKQEFREAKRVVGDIAKKHGFTLQQLLADAPAPVKRKKRQSAPRPPKPPKYQDPRSPEKAWSGFGRPPAWFKEHLANGKTPEDLLIT